MADTCVVERPGMKPYRARLQPSAQVWEDDDFRSPRWGVTVLRTHDIDRARALAHRVASQQDPEVVLSAGEAVWLRLVPWPDGDGSYERVTPDKRGALPCVVFEAVDL